MQSYEVQPMSYPNQQYLELLGFYLLHSLLFDFVLVETDVCSEAQAEVLFVDGYPVNGSFETFVFCFTGIDNHAVVTG